MLDELNALLQESKNVPEQTYEELPDGMYEGIIEGGEFAESKASGNLMFKWTLSITDGEYKNRKVWKYTVLNKPENMKRLTTDLNKFGVNTSTMDSINNDLENILDVPVIIEIKTKGEYRNTSIKPIE